MQAMLLAAGLGTRLRPYTLIRPKPLFPVLNVPLLHLLLDRLFQAGCERVVVNCHHLADQIRSAVGSRSGVIIQYEPEILGTGGSLRQALDLFAEGPVLVMNGDIYHHIDLNRLLEHHLASGLPVTMAMHDYDRFNSVAVRAGKVRGFVGGFREHRGELLAFTGLHVLDTGMIRQIPGGRFFHIIDLYEQLAEAGRIGSLRVDTGFWRDIGTPDDYLALHNHLLISGKGDHSACGNTHRSWCISGQATVAEQVVFRDWGVVGPGAKIGRGVQLRRCVVWEGVSIAPGLRLEDTIVCQDRL